MQIEKPDALFDCYVSLLKNLDHISAVPTAETSSIQNSPTNNRIHNQQQMRCSRDSFSALRLGELSCTGQPASVSNFTPTLGIAVLYESLPRVHPKSLWDVP
eukprot:TRINITY_DN24509_c0_g1_i1.p1 TRINITY_DN24509_c0_g1~~TRINITY_DN24509_c0_g1_i1.p1  ORF type:complete len:102 (+),score=2.80 TRINITY_DN24509_c0_g1_i1:50-355(+)